MVIILQCDEEHKQEDIRTNGDCCFNHIIGLLRKKKKFLLEDDKIATTPNYR
jgi:hypothetical protein